MHLNNVPEEEGNERANDDNNLTRRLMDLDDLDSSFLKDNEAEEEDVKREEESPAS